MKSTCLFCLTSFLICNLMMACRAQSISGEEDPDPRTMNDLLLHRAESLLLRSILRKMQAEDDNDGGLSSQPAWLTKRQHPGKRYSEDVDEEADVGDEEYSDVERRQHPGKRSTTHGRLSDAPVIVVQGELSKRQHPGKRYVVIPRSRRQHPGKRQPDEEDDDAEEEVHLPELYRRQHPGKRFLDHPGLATISPCEDLSDSVRCAKANLLLDFLDDISDMKHAEEKRQHPGKRFAPEDGQ
ncbi:pro-thyrotropin-releasing hormone [Syngnathus scovelli]|uniref:pro-thyrotropin-releasing hormone n=1 Tax=Syngnathus scovelli TaxID=161590 RepID=UPI002110296A|nr:pro-thyrotropin-releasing hormone [Syngnathus scovelli]